MRIAARSHQFARQHNSAHVQAGKGMETRLPINTTFLARGAQNLMLAHVIDTHSALRPAPELPIAAEHSKSVSTKAC